MQYTEALGHAPMVPYWSLGFQLCRWGYTDIDHMKDAVGRMRQYDIPHDVQYGDIDYMLEKRDFTIDPVNFAGLSDYVDQLKSEGTRFVIILDPGISNQQTPGTYPPYDEGSQMEVWVKDIDGTTDFEGEVWPGLVFYPDFTKQETEDWWVSQSIAFKNDQLDYAGIWIDMNEPSNFIEEGRPGGCHDNRWNKPPYMPRILDGILEFKTFCMDTIQGIGTHYNAHSLYGWSMAKASFRAAREATGTRSIVFSRSTFPGTGQWAQHWLGDNWSEWSNLRNSIIGILEFNLFGFPYVGADICGFIGNATVEMCTRWQQLGAFYTFSRNHNAAGNPDQDPGMHPQVATVARATLHIRYTLLPYLYTLFHFAHTEGRTVIRPLMNEFLDDLETHHNHNQFMWGSGFLINPVLDEGLVTLRMYFPDARWFSYYDGKESTTRGDYNNNVAAPIDFIPLYVRGGFTLPTQQPANSTLFSRSLPMGLIVALDDDAESHGSLFWDDGESIDTFEGGQYFLATYTVDTQSLSSSTVHDGYPGVSSLVFDDIRIMGEAATISSVTVNGADHSSWTQDADTREISITTLNIQVNTEFTVAWS